MDEYEPNSQQKQIEGTADKVIPDDYAPNDQKSYIKIPDDYDPNDRDTYISDSITEFTGTQVGGDREETDAEEVHGAAPGGQLGEDDDTNARKNQKGSEFVLPVLKAGVEDPPSVVASMRQAAAYFGKRHKVYFTRKRLGQSSLTERATDSLQAMLQECRKSWREQNEKMEKMTERVDEMTGYSSMLAKKKTVQEEIAENKSLLRLR